MATKPQAVQTTPATKANKAAQVIASELASKAAKAPAPATTAKATSQQKPAPKVEAPATKAGQLTGAQIQALDSMTDSGGFYSRGIQYHAGKNNLIVTPAGDSVIVKLAPNSKLAARLAKNPDLLQQVKKAMQSGGKVGNASFIKAAKGSPNPYTIAHPSEGGAVSQVHFAALFAK